MRKIGLDIVRGLAVLFVLIRHSALNDANIIKHFGWLGVDLFFVLSGFLISNLLFIEYKKNKKIRVKRFLIRRAFKIFPPFYFFMLTTLLFGFATNNSNFEWNELLSELLYLQSYCGRIWLHTWSLAVEEQFYLIFSVLLLFLTRMQLLEKKHIIISSLVFLLILSFVMRFYVSYPHRNDEFFGFNHTHLRSDGILAGILVSYLLNFTNLTSLFLKRKWIPICISILFIAPGFYFNGGGFFMNTTGLTLVNIGFAIIVLLSLNIDEYISNNSFPYIKVLLKPIGFIGVNSYSIYLWHLNSKNIVSSMFSYDKSLMIVIYIIFSIALGVIMSYLIEKPSLKIRDYWFNKKTTAT